MTQEIKGNIAGLASAERHAIERLFRRQLSPSELVTPELAQEIYRLGDSLRRRIGILISREGYIEEVIVGTRDIIYLPDLGRYRLGRGRLRRLRLIFSDLSKGPHALIPTDIYTDLEKLRLDAVVSVKESPPRVSIAYAHLISKVAADGDGIERAVHTERVPNLYASKLDFKTLMNEVEDDLTASVEALHETGKLKAMVVGVYDRSTRSPESSMAELEELARTAGVQIVDRVMQRRTLDPRTLLGKGKMEEVVLRCLRVGAELLIFDTELKPSQWRVITNSTELKVIDRSMLILDIFAQRATSSEGRLQVELAQLKYNLPRLVEKDAGLSRLSGGIGGRGPGETKLEISRRRTRDRISDLEKRIARVAEQRQLRRHRRQEHGLPVVAIMGYTNVGKSTLFNVLTQSTVQAENKLFATLDPAQRRLTLPESVDGSVHYHPAIISDTVGFIRDLPNELRNAFRATLEEMYHADLLLHVLDASDPEIEERKSAVEGILSEMQLRDTPQLVVLNKIDRADSERVTQLTREYAGIAISAQERLGIGNLITRVTEALRCSGRLSPALPWSEPNGDGNTPLASENKTPRGVRQD